MIRHGEERKTVSSILIVDDDIFCRTAISSLLEKNGFKVNTATCGEEALSMIIKDEKTYDLVFVDLELPRMSGLELVKKLKKYHAHIPVFVVSGFQDKMTIMEMLKRDCKKTFIDMAKKTSE